jgi:hypothetical protein
MLPGLPAAPRSKHAGFIAQTAIYLLKVGVRNKFAPLVAKANVLLGTRWYTIMQKHLWIALKIGSQQR